MMAVGELEQNVTRCEYRHPNLAPTCLGIRDFNNLESCETVNTNLHYCDTEIPRSLITLKLLKITGTNMGAKFVKDKLNFIFF